MEQRSPGAVPRPRGGTPTLNSRDVEVLACLADGKSTAQIAGTLAVSSNTARGRVRRVERLLGVTDRDAAVRAAQDSGVLGIPRPRHPIG